MRRDISYINEVLMKGCCKLIRKMIYEARRGVMIFALFAAACLIMTGCGGQSEETVTAQSLVEEAEENALSASFVHADIMTGMTFDAGILGTYDIYMDLAIASSSEPEAVHMTGTVGMFGLELDTESYIVAEGDSITVYEGLFGEWYVSSSDRDVMDTGSVMSLLPGIPDSCDLTLSDEIRDHDGTQCYVITGRFDMSGLETVLGAVNDIVRSVTGDEQDHIGAAGIYFEYGISCDAREPVYIKMSFDESDTPDNDSVFGISGVSLEITYTDFGPSGTELITVPQEIIDRAVPVDENGLFSDIFS